MEGGDACVATASGMSAILAMCMAVLRAGAGYGTGFGGSGYSGGGYGSGAAFPEDRNMAEHAHWGQMHVAFMQYLREQGCGAQAANLINLPADVPLDLPGDTITNPLGAADLAGLTDRCGMLIAFAFGIAAHGITDETWDAQFEPEVRHQGEDPNIATFFDAQGFWGPFTPGSVLRLKVRLRRRNPWGLR